MDKNNTGEENTGNWNSGTRNSGNMNSGYRNSGNWNSGDWNPGNMNSGDWNSGYRNSGNWNSGNWNSGNWNSGDRNSGYRNSGDWNSGNWNSGTRNSGNVNSGDWNSGNWNSGYFNTGSPNRVQVFNQWVEMTPQEFIEKYNICADIPLNRWIEVDDIENPTKEQKQMGGYLKTLPFKEACVIWWKENPERHKDFLELPHFDAKIFEEITGIDVNEDEVDVTVEGTTERISRKSAIALGFLDK